ncbi:MAG TPA: NAD(P)-dependent oxidoreductase [Solirubrobacteraceae bacterium]|nr:NAD(P)-dependent oxidoreductase [Solirubrobacteraceae bacterium]
MVDGDALLSTLQARHIRAVLDVTDPEPLPNDHPLCATPAPTARERRGARLLTGSWHRTRSPGPG